MGVSKIDDYNRRQSPTKEDELLIELLGTIFVLLVWLMGVIAFAGPVMT